jgi:hypothetical protein
MGEYIVLSLTGFNLHRLGRLAPIAWRTWNWAAVPLEHALLEGEIGLRIPGEVARESAMMSPSIPI